MLGVAVAIGAQLALYLTLRRIAVATMPAWAHHHAHRPVAPVQTGPVLVGVALVGGAAATPPSRAAPDMPPPVLQDVPVVPVPVPALSQPGLRSGPQDGGASR